MAVLNNTKTQTQTDDLSWMDQAQDIDQNTVENEGPQFPFVQWVQRNPKAKKKRWRSSYTGGWFMQGQQLAVRGDPRLGKGRAGA